MAKTFISSNKIKVGMAAAVGTVLLGLGAGALAQTLKPDVRSLLTERLPKTKLTAVNCEKIAGLCEVQAGSNLFYTDRGGRYLIIGRVYDMETRQDLTAARLLEINPDILLGGAATAGAIASREEASAPAMGSPSVAPDQKLDLSRLSNKGAIRWGEGSRSVTVFSDFRCGYCRALHQSLKDMNISVIERPISILGTREISNAVLCASDRGKAVAAAYAGQPVTARSCDTSGLNENEAFARTNGITGTPVIVRGDGAVIQGYRPREFLEQWIKGGKS